MSNLLSLQQVSKLLDKSEATIRRYARENLLTPLKDEENEDMHFDEGEVKRYLEISKKFLN